MTSPHGLLRLGGLLGLLALPEAALAQDTCRQALVLALDVSASVDDREYRLQREGLAVALSDPDVVRLILSEGPVAIYVFEWASPGTQEALIPDWTVIREALDLEKIVEAVREHPRTAANDLRKTTAIGSALTFAGAAFANLPAPCLKQTIDVSGDGPNNAGPDVRGVYANGAFEGISVNALVIEGDSASVPLTAWFRSHVLRGRGAFALTADGYEDFRRAMKAKLLRELAAPTASSGKLAERAG